MVSAYEDHTLTVWAVHAVATLQAHTSKVTACAVTADGQHVVSASEDKHSRCGTARTSAR